MHIETDLWQKQTTKQQEAPASGTPEAMEAVRRSGAAGKWQCGRVVWPCSAYTRAYILIKLLQPVLIFVMTKPQ